MADTSLAEAQSIINLDGSRYYVYILKSPNGDPFYVGKGNKRRIAVHEEHAKTKRRSRKLSIIRGIWNRNESVVYEIAGFFSDENDAHKLEVNLIKKFGRKDIYTGILANTTDGGEGVSGHVHSKESRTRMSESALNSSVYTIEERTRAFNERREKPEFIAKKKASEAARIEKVSAHQKSQKNREEKSLQMKSILANNPDLLAKRLTQFKSATPIGKQSSDAAKNSWANPVERARRIEALKKAQNDPALLEKKRIQMVNQHKDQEFKKNHSERMKAHWVKRKLKESESRGVGA